MQQGAAKAERTSCNLGAGVMTRVWIVKWQWRDPSHFTSASPLEVGRKLVPAQYGVFRLQVSSSYRELFRAGCEADPERPGLVDRARAEQEAKLQAP